MKKVLAIILAALMLLSFSACGKNEGEKVKEKEKETKIEEEAEEEGSVTETDYIKIDGLCVDESYENEDGLKMLYMFFTITAKESNLDESSVGWYITINDANEYYSENHVDSAAAAKFAKSYYYSSYVEDIYVGNTLKMMATLEVPEGDLAAGKTITFKNDGVPDMEKLAMTTDDIQYFATPEEMAQAIDPDGYAEEMLAREDADADTAEQVKNLIVTGEDYAWTFYVNSLSYEIHFYDDYTFKLITKYNTATGVFSVKNGYVFCTYPDTGYTIEVPYTVENGELGEFELADAFDVNM